MQVPIHVEPVCTLSVAQVERLAPDRVRVTYGCSACTLAYTAEYELAPCDTCNAAGGTLESELQGDGYMTGLVYFFIECDDCIAIGFCPGCSLALTPAEYELATTNIEAFEHTLCGWRYDPDRHYNGPDEPDYTPDDDRPYTSDYDPDLTDPYSATADLAFDAQRERSRRF